MERGLSLYEEHSPTEKRKHFSAEFDKFYSVYAFDFTKYNKLCKMLSTRDFKDLNLFEDINPEEFQQLRKFDKDKVKEYCYVLDENGKRRHLGDEAHIYRVNVLKKLREALIPYIDFSILMSFQQDLSSEIKREFKDYTYYEERYTTEYYIHGGTRNKGQSFVTKDIELNWVADADIKTQINAYISVLRLCKKGTSLDEAVNRVKKRYRMLGTY